MYGKAVFHACEAVFLLGKYLPLPKTYSESAK